MQTENKRIITLTDAVILRIRSNKRLRSRICFDLDITHSTLYRWLRVSDSRLTTATMLDILSEHLKMAPADMLEERIEPVTVE